MRPPTAPALSQQQTPKAKVYEKGTKKFWEKTMEIKQSSSL